MDFYPNFKNERAGMASQVALVLKNLPANAGDIRGPGSTSGSRRSPGERNDNPEEPCRLQTTGSDMTKLI